MMQKISLDTISVLLSGVQIVIPSFVISLILPKKKNFVLRYVISFLMSLFVLTLAALNGYGCRNTWWFFLFIHVYSVLSIGVCNDCNIKLLCYTKIWSTAIYHLILQLQGLTVTIIDAGKFEDFIGISRAFYTMVMIVITYLLFGNIYRKKIESITWIEILQGSIIMCIILPINRLLYIDFTERNQISEIIFLMQLFSVFCIILVLYMQLEIHCKQALKAELQLKEQVWKLEKKHFTQNKKQIDLINRKCHDLKYQISALQYVADKELVNKNIKELKEVVNVYDDTICAGNMALEVLLAEKQLQFKEAGVKLVCTVENASVYFIDTIDLYIMFGNALDNAFESAVRISDTQERIIELKIYRDKNFIRISVTNYFIGEITLVNGLPVSSKVPREYHGNGIRSMRQIAQKYKGELVVEINKNKFVLKIMIPVSDN